MLSNPRANEEIWLLLGLLVIVAGLVSLVAAEPFDLGYRKPAELAVSMLASGNWVSQQYADGRLYLDKPPLLTWIVAAVARFTKGPLTWEQHVPGLLAFVLMVFWTGKLARGWFGTRRAGLLAALVLATTFGFPTLIRTKRLDPIFAAFVTGSLYYAYHSLATAQSPPRRSALTLLAWAFVALATLTKGPLALLVFLGALVPFLFWTGRWREVAWRSHGAGALLCTALVLAWPLLLLRDVGAERLLAMLRDTDLATREAGPLLYFTNAPVRMLPWTLLIPALLGWRGGDDSRQRSDAVRFLLCWALAVFVPLQIPSAKHYRYLLPAYPAFACLVTAFFHDPTLTGWLRRWRDAVSGGVLVLLLIAAAVAPIVVTVMGERVPLGLGGALLLAPLVGVPASLGLLALRRKQALRAFGFALVATACAYAVQFVLIARLYRSWDGTHLVESALVAPLDAGYEARTLSLSDDGEGLALIATRRSVPAVADVDALRAWIFRAPGGRGVVMTGPADAERVQSDPRLSVLRRTEVDLDHHPVVFLEIEPRRDGS